ncbi:uncharacterized protein [Chelonus insularis]|uniref:uncharacterized protein n=1 Tax=Chelonus insularis TaxID=460826 RepID=UPI00158F1765|nr:uncharacterized protein LOC118069766 [Chelonus insularis]
MTLKYLRKWIHKMLFLWSREPTPRPKATSWFAWLTTVVLLWGFRRRLLKTIRVMSPLRFLKRLHAPVQSLPKLMETPMTSPKTDKHVSLILHPKYGLDVKRQKKPLYTPQLCSGDGPHVSNHDDMIETIEEIYYRVTRSGRVYGQYPNKVPLSIFKRRLKKLNHLVK